MRFPKQLGNAKSDLRQLPDREILRRETAFLWTRNAFRENVAFLLQFRASAVKASAVNIPLFWPTLLHASGLGAELAKGRADMAGDSCAIHPAYGRFARTRTAFREDAASHERETRFAKISRTPGGPLRIA